VSTADDLGLRIDELRAFEREYRQRLRMHLEDCLGVLEATEDAKPLRVAARRLGEASDADLLEVLAELPEHRRQRLVSALLRIPVPEVAS
jgi:hypothetical protein